jgi:glycine dehydrogenase subunit 1
VHPQYLEVAHTYVQHAGIELQQSLYCTETGTTLPVSLSAIDDRTAAVVVQSPNFFGCVEDLQALGEKAHAHGALLIVAVTEAMSFGLLRSPGACGADIVVAEGQPLACRCRLADLRGVATATSMRDRFPAVNGEAC